MAVICQPREICSNGEAVGGLWLSSGRFLTFSVSALQRFKPRTVLCFCSWKAKIRFSYFHKGSNFPALLLFIPNVALVPKPHCDLNWLNDWELWFLQRTFRYLHCIQHYVLILVRYLYGCLQLFCWAQLFWGNIFQVLWHLHRED